MLRWVLRLVLECLGPGRSTYVDGTRTAGFLRWICPVRDALLLTSRARFRCAVRAAVKARGRRVMRGQSSPKNRLAW